MISNAITVENISKRYLIGHQRAKGEGLRHVIESAATAPLRWLKSAASKRSTQAEPELPTTEEFWALKDVSFEVQRGEAIGIIGRNGAGKSTLLKILSRITEPTQGRITLQGRVASLLEVGTGFHPELTGRENIFLNGAILGMSRQEIKGKFDEIVAFAEVERFIDTPVKRYSSGMYVRLAFAVAAHLEPEILIVDEVLAVGDSQFQKKCLGKMGEVAQSEGRTILFVSHNMAAIKALCGKAVMLKEGRVEGFGPTNEIARLYLADFENSSSSISFAHRKNRNPAVTVRGGSLKSKGSACCEFTIGDDIEIILQIEVRQPVTYGIEFTLRDELGTPVGFFASDMQNGLSFSPCAGVWEHRCVMPSVRLAEGNYSLNIMIAEPLVQYHETIENGFVFEIAPSPLVGTPRRVSQQGGQGPTVLDLCFEEAPTPL